MTDSAPTRSPRIRRRTTLGPTAEKHADASATAAISAGSAGSGEPIESVESVDPVESGAAHGFLTILLSNAAWSAGARVGGAIASFLFFVLLSHYFGSAGLGRYSFGFAIATMIFALVNLGLEDYAIRESSRSNLEQRRRLLDVVVGTQFSLAVCAGAILGLCFATGLLAGEAGRVILFLTGFQIAFALSRSLFVPPYVDEQMAAPAVVDLTTRVGAIAGAAAGIAWFGLSLSWALVAFPIAGAVLVARGMALARKHNGGLSPRVNLAEARQLLTSAWPFGLSIVVYILYTRTDLVMLRLIRDESAAGIYSSALKFFEVGVLPVFFLGIAAYPSLSRLRPVDPAGFARVLDGFLRSTLVVAGLLAWALYWVVPEVLVLMLGSEFAAAGTAARWMSLLALITAVETVGLRLLLAADMQVVRVRLQTFALVFNVALNALLIPAYGVMGAVAASIVSLFALAAAYLLAARRAADVAPLTRATVVFSVIGVATAGTGVVLAQSGVGDLWNGLATLCVFAGAVAATRFVPVDALRRSTSA